MRIQELTYMDYIMFYTVLIPYTYTTNMTQRKLAKFLSKYNFTIILRERYWIGIYIWYIKLATRTTIDYVNDQNSRDEDSLTRS